MNYGLLNFKAQNGKPGIFWSNEKEKKPERKFGYKTRDQRYNLRQYPTDMRTDADNLLQPVNQPEEEKPKKPATNFIKRNRDHIAKKSGKNKENDKTVTLTQEQLNAILASVGKVASGKEDALRISIDADKHEITVESPGRDGDGDHKKGRRHRDRKKKDEEQSIFALLDDKNSSRDADEKSRHRDRTPERLDSSDRHRNRKHSNDRDHHRKHSGDRDHRSNSHDRHRNHSSERHRKHSGDRYRRDSRERDRRHTPERRRHSSERHRTPSRERRRHSPDERSRERRKYSPDDRSQERRRHSKSPEDRYRKDSPSEGRYRKSTPERDERKNEKPKVEENPPSPREIAGIPVSLPWKHMTKAERRRKEEEEKRKNYQELETKLLNKNFKKDDYRRDDSRRDDQYRREDDRISDSDRGSSLKTNSLPASTTNSKVSLGELKRRQWEKERADSTTTGEFQPWGRPGAGAPIRTKSGNIAADYSKRKELLYPFVNHRN